MTVSTDPRKTGVFTGPIGSGTFAQMKAITGMSDGDAYLVTNYGRGGSLWRYSVTLTDWFPVAPTKVYENTTVISGVAQAATQVLLAISLEANLLNGKTFRVITTLAKNGGTDTMTPAFRMGTAGTAADALVTQPGTLAGTARAVGLDTWLRMASATSVERLGGSPIAAFGAISTTGVVSAAVTVGDVTAGTTFATFTCTMSGTTDTPQLGYLAIEIQP